MIKKNFAILLVLFCLTPGKLFAYSSVTVPIEDPVYRKLDKLESFGLITSMMSGQRPYVRSEVARLIAEAMKNYPEFEKNYRENNNLSLKQSEQMLQAKIYVDRILEVLKRQYHQELVQRGAVEGEVPTLDGQPLEYIQANYMYLDEPKQIFPLDNGLGGINGRIQDLVENRGGRHYQSGSNWAIETSHWARLGKYVALQVQPRFQFQVAKAPLQDENKVFVQRANAHFTLGKLDLEFGRDSINWGSSNRGGLTFSPNARPLDFIKVSSISPFLFPFFFKNLGPFEMSLVIANLGSEQFFKNPWFVAHKISSRRNEYFEFGMTQTLLSGGEGAPSESFGSRILDFFDWSQNEDNLNRAVSFDLLGRIPKIRGLEIYTEIYFSDFTSNMKNLWVRDTSYLAGIFLPRLNYRGTMDLRLEYRRTAPRYSRSQIFIDGLTENRLLIGDPLGPDAWSVMGEFFLELNPKNLFQFLFQYSHRNYNYYVYQNGDINPFADFGDENRILYQASWKHLFNKHFYGYLNFGFENVLNAGFRPGADEFNWLGEVGFRWYFSPNADL